MTLTRTACTATALSLVAMGGIAHAQAPTWEDHAFGDTFWVGDTTIADGVHVSFGCFNWTPPGGQTCIYMATVDNANDACGMGLDLNLNNINAKMDFASTIGPQSDLQLLFGEYGGNLNIAINGQYANFQNFIDIDGLTFGGVTVEVNSGGGGNDCGMLTFRGITESLMIGGQELWIDWAVREPNGCEDAYVDYDDMTSATIYAMGDTATTSGIAGAVTIEFVPQLFMDGTTFDFGNAVANPVGLSCGNGMELQTYAIAANHDFAGTIGTLVNVTVKVADHGGTINYGVNGSIAAANLYADLDGINLGGCILHVVSGGGLNECTELFIEGQVGSLLLGGGQHMIDCIEAQEIINANVQGDFNGDGKVNGADLGLALAGWGTPSGDVNGDGTTSGADLGLILAAWTN